MPDTTPVILVAIHLPTQRIEDVHDSLRELERLAATLGYRVIGTMFQARSSSRSPTALGEGKIEELAARTGGTGKVETFQRKKSKARASENFEQREGPKRNSGEKKKIEGEKAAIVLFDCDLTPSQMRNIEGAIGVPVLDRTGVIIEIFSKHAKTKAAKLQIEIARLNYLAPRIRETEAEGERAGGGIGAIGSGESKAELDRRRIRDRLKELRTELDSISKEQVQRRQRRLDENCIALVGYTNAGKSSLMRALTGSQVLVANQLFATLDTTVRPLMPESHPRILVSDTVGFIKKLPHDLVASFKSTLDEALNASLLLIVTDASDPAFRSQLAVTRGVLKEVGADAIPYRVLLNKSDLLTAEQRAALMAEFPEARAISTLDKADVRALRDEVVTFFEKEMVEEIVFVKYGSEGAIGDLRSRMRVVKEDYVDDGVNLTVRARPDDLARWKKKF
jgi:GTP-binding protein HflX